MTNKTEKTIISADDFEYLLAYARIAAYDNAVVFEAKQYQHSRADSEKKYVLNKRHRKHQNIGRFLKSAAFR
jgi:hypothetical protein